MSCTEACVGTESGPPLRDGDVPSYSTGEASISSPTGHDITGAYGATHYGDANDLSPTAEPSTSSWPPG